VEKHFDQKVLPLVTRALEDAQVTKLSLSINNTDQAVGTLLGNEITKRYLAEGLPEDTIVLNLEGSAGQSLGAFIPKGLTIELSGDANDYVAKGLSGGTVVLRPAKEAVYPAEANVIAGNVVGYGATSGEIFLRGIVGERFLVRNSGAIAVAEGVGDHALEYMTGGTAVILGKTGRNLAAGMSGGTAFVYRLRKELVNQQALASGELSLSTLSTEDAVYLQQILGRHLAKTGSELAKRILANFEEELANFTKLLPRDYANVLAIQASARAEGLQTDSPEIWSRILEVSARG
jgi:glutamate synthase (NADPH/NADH) large chain